MYSLDFELNILFQAQKVSGTDFRGTAPGLGLPSKLPGLVMAFPSRISEPDNVQEQYKTHDIPCCS